MPIVNPSTFAPADNTLLGLLAASSGSSLVGFIQSGTGAVATAEQTELRRIVWAEQYGADPLGIVDSTAAFSNALAVAKHVRFGEGTFLVDTVALVGNGYILEGMSTRASILKARTNTSTKLLDIHGSGSYAQNNVCKNFTLDITNMTDLASRYGIYQTYAYNGRFEQIFVIGYGVNKLSYFAESAVATQGVYTMSFVSCDFGSTVGKIKLLGTSLGDAITTHDFISCAFGAFIGSYFVSVNFYGGTVQGALDKFTVDHYLGLHINGLDVEGTGTYQVYGIGADHHFSIGNQFSGFSGTYESGTVPSVGTWLDPYGTGVFRLNKPTVTLTGSLAAIGDATVTGILTAQKSINGTVRHVFNNTNAGASRRTDLQISTNSSASEALFIGVDQAGSGYKGYWDNRSGGAVVFQLSGTTKFTWNTNDITWAESFNQVFGTTSGSKIGTATNQKIGFWNAAPIIQPASANQAAVTDSTGGTASFTIAAITAGAAYAQADMTATKDGLATLARQVNELRNVLVNTGLMKGAA